MCSISRCHFQNWPEWKRWYITTVGGILVFNSFVDPILGVYLRLLDLFQNVFQLCSVEPAPRDDRIFWFWNRGCNPHNILVYIWLLSRTPSLGAVVRRCEFLKAVPLLNIYSIPLDRSPSRLSNRDGVQHGICLLPSPDFMPDCSLHRHRVFKSAVPCRKTLRLF